MRGFDSLMNPTGMAIIVIAMLLIFGIIFVGGFYMRATIAQDRARQGRSKPDENPKA